MSSTLYELTNEALVIQELLEDSGGELDSAVAARLAAWEEAWATKHDAIRCVISEFERRGESRAAEADRLAKLAVADASAASGLRGYLKREMERLGMKKFETDRFRSRIQANGTPRIEWTGDPTDPPMHFGRVTVALDGKAAQAWYKANGWLPDGFVVEKGTHLRLE